jgi:phage tail sheath protein FI
LTAARTSDIVAAVHPGVYVDEDGTAGAPIAGVPTGGSAFVGTAERGPFNPRRVTSGADFDRVYGSKPTILRGAARAFFANGGKSLWISRARSAKTLGAAVDALAAVAGIELVAAPEAGGRLAVAEALAAHARAHKRIALVDGAPAGSAADAVGLRAHLASPWATVHHPWVEAAGRLLLPPSGFVAGAYAAERPWLVPAQPLKGVVRVAAVPRAAGVGADGVNLVREFPGRGVRLWGARTASDEPEWRYVNVRRYLAYLEHSIDEGTRWTVFEPNAEPLWQMLRGVIERFLLAQWRDGALQGRKAGDAFFVRCDRTTMTQADIDAGRLVCDVGVATVRPAEFVVLRFRHTAAKPDDDP